MAFKIADAYVEVETRYDKDTLIKGLDGAITSEKERIRVISRERMGSVIGDGMSEGASRGFRNGMKKREDKDGKSIAKGLVSKIASPFGAGLIEAVSLGFANANLGRAMASNPYVATAGLAVGTALATTIAAGLAATLSAALAGALGLGLIGLGAFLLRKEPEIKASAKRLGDTFRNTFGDAAGAMLIPFVQAMNLLAAAIERNQPLIDKLFRTFAPVIVPLTEGLIGFMEALGPGLEALAEVGADVLLDLAKNLPKWGKSLGDFFILIRDNWPEIKKSLESFFRDLGTLLRILSAAFIWLATSYDDMRERLKLTVVPPGLTLAIKILDRDWKGDWDRLMTRLSGYGRAVVGFFRDLPGNSYRAVSGFWNRIRPAFTGAGLGMRINTGQMTQWVVTHLRGLPGRAAAALSGMRRRVVGAFSGAATWLWGKGWDIVSGLASGIRSAADSILRWAVNSVADAIPDWIANRLGIRSPSTVMAERIGEHIPAGIAMGAKKGEKQLKADLGGMGGRIPDYVGGSYAETKNSTTYGGHTFDVKVFAGFGVDGPKLSRDIIAKLRQMLDDYDRSVKNR